MREFLDTAIMAAKAAGALQRERLWLEHDIAFKGRATWLPRWIRPVKN